MAKKHLIRFSLFQTRKGEATISVSEMFLLLFWPLIRERLVHLLKSLRIRFGILITRSFWFHDRDEDSTKLPFINLLLSLHQYVILGVELFEIPKYTLPCIRQCLMIIVVILVRTISRFMGIGLVHANLLSIFPILLDVSQETLWLSFLIPFIHAPCTLPRWKSNCAHTNNV